MNGTPRLPRLPQSGQAEVTWTLDPEEREWLAQFRETLRHLAHDLAATSYALPSIVAYTEAEWARLGRLGSPFRAAVERDGVSVL